MLDPNVQGGSEVLEIQTDLADNLLPEDAKVDFALIDVEKTDLECLEGMKKNHQSISEHQDHHRMGRKRSQPQSVGLQL